MQDLSALDDRSMRKQRKKPSHVILALGHPADYAASTIRIGLGKDLTLETIDKVVEILSSARSKLAEKEEAND